MFERYTERARRVVFFARYEASQYGSPSIDTEHLLLGLLREDKGLLVRFLPTGAGEAIRIRVNARTPARPSFPTNVDLPLSESGKRVLKYAADEADRLADNHIGTKHLFLGLLHEEKGMAATILQEFGVDVEKIRGKISVAPAQDRTLSAFEHPTRFPANDDIIQIHGASRDAAHIRSLVAQYQRHPWYWRQEAWLPRDIVAHVATEQTSFDLSLANDAANFKLVGGGWASENCAICGWRLFESTTLSHGSGFTNGRDWVCTECYEKFFANFKPVPPPLAEIT